MVKANRRIARKYLARQHVHWCYQFASSARDFKSSPSLRVTLVVPTKFSYPAALVDVFRQG